MHRNGHATRARILDAAERLVIEGGYSATSLDAIIDAAGTSKGAFFHHFASKADLADALVRRYAAADVGQLERALDETASIADPGERLLAFLDWFVERADELMGEQSNCLYVAVLSERELVGTATAAPIGEAIVSWRRGIAGLVAAARPDAAVGGEDARGVTGMSADDLADHVCVTFEGAFVLARATGEAAHMRRQLAVLRTLVASWLSATPANAPSGAGSAGS